MNRGYVLMDTEFQFRWWKSSTDGLAIQKTLKTTCLWLFLNSSLLGMWLNGRALASHA
jgi:hypothetical protein